jgi:hypothetical protein
MLPSDGPFLEHALALSVLPFHPVTTKSHEQFTLTPLSEALVLWWDKNRAPRFARGISTAEEAKAKAKAA